MISPYVVANRTGTAWWSHVDSRTGRQMWTKAIRFATCFTSLYSAKRHAKRVGGTVVSKPPLVQVSNSLSKETP